MSSSSRYALPALALAALTACTADNGGVAGSDPENDAGAGGAHATDAGTGGAGGDLPAGGSGGDVAPGGSGGAAGAGGEGSLPVGGDGGGLVPDAGLPSECDPACARVADCAGEVCGEAAAGSRDAILADCADACGANPSFPIVAGGVETCPDLVEFARQSLGETFDALCDESLIPDETFPVCDVFADRIRACLAEPCPLVEQIADAAYGAFRYFCNGAGNRGEFDPEQLAMLITPETPCEAPILANIVEEQVAEGGPLSRFCAEGPLTSAETCAAGCDAIGPCIMEGDEGEAARDPLYCRYICAASVDPPSSVWACLAALGPDRCQDLGQCFQMGPPPPVPACEPYGERVAECTEEACAALSVYHAGLSAALRDFCNGLVAGNEEALAVIEQVGPETPCEHEAVAAMVVGLTQDDPQNEDDGFLAAYCAEMGGPRTPEQCADLCERFAPCVELIPAGSPFRDAAQCQFQCGASSSIADAVWTCIGGTEAGDCEATFACFQ